MFEKRLHNLKIIYAIAFALIAMTLLSTSLLMQYAIQSNSGDSRIINLSGRQRMLSQRLTKCVLALEHSKSDNERARHLQEIRESFPAWKAAHLGLQYGDEKLGLQTSKNSPEIKVYFAEIEPYHASMVEALETLIKGTEQKHYDKTVFRIASDKLLTNETRFLNLMDKITFQFDKEAKERIASMQRLEMIILAAGLLVLLLEFIFVFRPSVSQMSALITALKEKTDQQSESNKRLQDSLKSSLLLNKTLRLLSKTDGLLQIANRRHFDEMLIREWRRAKRNGSPLSLLIIDVDHFKLYNDEYGHLAGDDCLKKVANVINLTIRRAADQLARYGGEELAVILPETDTPDAVRLAGQIHENLSRLAIPHKTSPVDSHVTISIGIASTTHIQGSTPGALILAADEAMYEAKQSGRNCTRIKDSSSPGS